MGFPASALPHVLLRFEIPVDDSQAVQVVEPQRQLCKVELDVLLGEHDLQEGRGSTEVLGLQRGQWDHLCCTSHIQVAPSCPFIPKFPSHPEAGIKQQHQTNKADC